MEYLGIIIAMVGSVAVLIGVVIALFLWTRGEARNDARLMQTKIDEDSGHYDNKLESIRELVRAIHDEVKDFHTRMYLLEEKKLKGK